MRQIAWRKQSGLRIGLPGRHCEVKNSLDLGTPRLFLQRVRKALKKKEMSCRARQKSVPSVHPSKKALGARKSERKSGRAEERRGGGKITFPDIGNPDGYQKKGVAGQAKWIVVKTKGIANLAQIGTRERV